MKKQIKLSIAILIAFIIFCLFHVNQVEAAGVSLTGNQTVTAGQPVTVTASVTAGAWNLTLSGGGKSQALVGQTTVEGNQTATASITFVANSDTTVTLTGDMTDYSSDVSQTVSRSTRVSVNTASSGNNNTPPTGGTTNNGNPGGSTATGGTTGGSTSGSGTSSNQNPYAGEEPVNTAIAKSNIASLANFGIRPNDFSGFTPNKTSYSVKVPNSVSSVEVYAEKGHSKQTIAGTGTKNLKEGENTFTITVTAEDGTTKKSYTININREKAEENDKEEEKENKNENNNQEENKETKSGIATLTVEGLELIPVFSTDIYEYTIKLTEDKEKLEINATTIEENDKIEITGNENLKEGENVITILVNHESGEETVTYQIKVNKTLIDEEAIAKQKEEQEKKKKILIIGILGAILILGVVIFIIRHIRNRRLDEQYYFENDEWEDNDKIEGYHHENIYDDKLNDIDSSKEDDNHTIKNNESYEKDISEYENDNIDETKNTYSKQNDDFYQKITDKFKNNEVNRSKKLANEEDLSENEQETNRKRYLKEFFEDTEELTVEPLKRRKSKGKRFK